MLIHHNYSRSSSTLLQILFVLILSTYSLFNGSSSSIFIMAFPGGAGGCAGNMAAVSEYHLDTSNNRMVLSSAFDVANIEVSIDGQVLDGTTTPSVPTGQDLTVTVTARNAQYRGILLRLEAPSGTNTVGALVPGTNTQVSNQCDTPIVGVTHVNSSEKTASSATLRFDEEVSNVILDITIVFQNDSTLSSYAYNRFNVNFRQSGGVPVPVMAPVAAPMIIPIPTTTSTTNSPTNAPIMSPVVDNTPTTTAPILPAPTVTTPTVTTPAPSTFSPTMTAFPTITALPTITGFPTIAPTPKLIPPTKSPTNAPIINVPINVPIVTTTNAPIPIVTSTISPITNVPILPTSSSIIPSISPTIESTVTESPSNTNINNGITVISSVIFQLSSVPGPITNEIIDVFLLVCTDFYTQLLPDSLMDVECTLSSDDDNRRRRRQLPATTTTTTIVDLLVDVTATFANAMDAIGFDIVVVVLANQRSDDFVILLQNAANDNNSLAVQLYFRSVMVRAIAIQQPMVKGGMMMNMGKGISTGKGMMRMGKGMNIFKNGKGKGSNINDDDNENNDDDDISGDMIPSPAYIRPPTIPKSVLSTTTLGVKSPTIPTAMMKSSTTLTTTSMSSSSGSNNNSNKMPTTTRTSSSSLSDTEIRLKNFLHQNDP